MLLLIFGVIKMGVAQTRDVVWVHGYGETQSHWANYNDLFGAERQMTTNNTEYTLNANEGVAAMANDINNRVGNNANTILVGHSLGGVAAAEADNGVRGIITFGAPIDGAHIANAVANGGVENETRHAVREMTAGPKAQFHVLYVIATVASWKITGEGLGKLIENEVVKKIGLDRYSSDQVFQDLRTTSSYMQGKQFRGATPKISVWGNENSPVHYRLASSLASSGTSDTRFVNATAVAKGVYLGFQRNNEAAGVLALIGGFWNPWGWGASAYAFWTAHEWKRGKDYLTGSEGSWKWLIGAYRYETTTYQSYEKVVCNDEMGRIAPIDIGENCDEWRWVTHSYTRLIKEPSDGFIDKGSQVGARTSTWNPTQVEALGVNHMEMGTHPRTEQILREAWDGQYGATVNNPFAIPIR